MAMRNQLIEPTNFLKSYLLNLEQHLEKLNQTLSSHLPRINKLLKKVSKKEITK